MRKYPLRQLNCLAKSLFLQNTCMPDSQKPKPISRRTTKCYNIYEGSRKRYSLVSMERQLA